MFQPCTYGQWTSRLSHSVSTTMPARTHGGLQARSQETGKTGRGKVRPLQAYHRTAAPHRTGSSFRTEKGIRLQGVGRCFNQKLYVNRGKAEPSKGGTAHHHASQQTDDSAGEQQEIHVHARLPLLAHTLQSLHFITVLYIYENKVK